MQEKKRYSDIVISSKKQQLRKISTRNPAIDCPNSEQMIQNDTTKFFSLYTPQPKSNACKCNNISDEFTTNPIVAC
jgi:hypothetical protein